MSPISSHQKSPAATDTQLIIHPSSNPDHQPSMQTVEISRRQSDQTIKHALMARSRANSIASFRRSSWAGSRQSGAGPGVDGQTGVALPGDFDLTCLDPNMFFQFDGLQDNFELVPGQAISQDRLPFVTQQQLLQAQFDSTASIDPAILGLQPSGTDVFDPTLFATPGLTAVPGTNDFNTDQSAQYQQGQPYIVYPDPSNMWDQPQQPYFISQQGHAQNPQYGYMQNPQQKCARSESDSEDDVPLIKRQRANRQINNLSEDDSDSYKTKKPVRKLKSERLRQASRDSGHSSESSLGQPKPHAPLKTGERPQKCEDKPWVRTNNITVGNTRSARINEEMKEIPKYKCKDLPHGNWSSRKFTFEYSNPSGHLDEFKKKKMPARQIFEYIIDFPSDELRLWIQKSPADVARRYGSPGHNKCLFEQCPKHAWGDNGTIDVGHYRVAFDEKFKAFGNKTVDPFDCPGFVHLYCLERFCDFEYICQNVDIEVDIRVYLPREPKKKNAANWTFSGQPELEVAQYFLKACKKNQLRETQLFANYPVHTSSQAPKDYSSTLCRAMTDQNIAARSRSQLRQFVDRHVTCNVILVHKGDEDMALTKKKIKASKVYKKATKSKRYTEATFPFEKYYDDYGPLINQHIAECAKKKEELDAEDAAGLAPKKSKAKAKNNPRKRAAPVEDGDLESPVFDGRLDALHDADIEELYPYHPQQRGTRSSPRKRQRLNYAVDIDEPEAYPPFEPRNQVAQPQSRDPGPYVDQGYMTAEAARKASASHLFTKDPYFQHDFEQLPQEEGELMQADFEALLQATALRRRKSSTMSNGPMYAGISKLRSPRSLHGSLRSPEFRRVMTKVGRQASFADQPVISSREFGVDDPPNSLQLDGTPTRRSSRLASKSVSQS
ncbi:hypothetical protein EK21DRAFT_57276 [Setomelanomma holmii]|uniref:Uncharacterized protein n=1 Tax=Setomelanomma holmii TaxID=210430 RepID=A0A9P4LR68_9PLEO|nr:hypothetical protein EK21DRAFT_57276 [Setomelanomma holmii]